MHKYQQIHSKKNNGIVATLFEEPSRTITLKKEKQIKQNAIHPIFQDIPKANKEHRLIISPGYLEFEKIGSSKKINVTEYINGVQKKGFSDVHLSVKNPNILTISGMEITVLQAGSTILTAKKDGLSDSIQVEVNIKV